MSHVPKPRHLEHHSGHRGGWLRAAVLGANDGIVSTASLMIGVGATSAEPRSVLVAGAAGLIAGALSMAAGEYVSVHSQADAEHADLSLERWELAQFPEAEQRELAQIYQRRGLSHELAQEVARQLMERDALSAHARDELGWTPDGRARPVQAAVASAGSFAVGAMLPLLVGAFAPQAGHLFWIMAASLICLAILGGWAANSGGASVWRGAARVTLWSAVAMGATALIGHALGVAMG